MNIGQELVNFASDTDSSILMLESIADSLNVSVIVSPAIAIFDINNLVQISILSLFRE